MISCLEHSKRARLALLIAWLSLSCLAGHAWAEQTVTAPDRANATATTDTDGNANEKDGAKPPSITLPVSERLKRIFAAAPKDVDELKAMQQHVQELAQQVVQCTVAVRLQGGMGSGVIVSPDGYVLTAGHVVGRPGRDVTFVLHDGRKVRGKTLGANYGIDSGLMKITTEGDWPYAELGKSSDLKAGHWCLATGHPGGFQDDRSPPVRLGRVLFQQRRAIVTDCTLVGGDSGGPLFDMQGKIVGIHSRIGNGIKANLHVPVDTYHETWDRLVAGKAWGGRRPGGPVIGVIHDREAEDATIAEVVGGSPAEKAGIKKGDCITRFDGKDIATFEDLAEAVGEKEPGDKVTIHLRRGEKNIKVELTVGSYGL
jgi:serine protease Do